MFRFLQSLNISVRLTLKKRNRFRYEDILDPDSIPCSFQAKLMPSTILEALSDCSAELNVVLPNMESLARVVQRSRAQASGSANHSEASLSTDFVLPPTCRTTLRGDNFILFDGDWRDIGEQQDHCFLCRKESENSEGIPELDWRRDFLRVP